MIKAEDKYLSHGSSERTMLFCEIELISILGVKTNEWQKSVEDRYFKKKIHSGVKVSI
jgi:hypothetical protein